MGRKILVAVDDSVHSKQAVAYAARISSAVKDVAYTLFNVEALIPRIFKTAADTDPQVRNQVAQLVRKNSETARYAVEACKHLMVREGIPESRVEAVTEPMQVGPFFGPVQYVLTHAGRHGQGHTEPGRKRAL